MVFAHDGHILIDAPLFLAPVVLLGGALSTSARHHKRESGENDSRRRPDLAGVAILVSTVL